MNGTATWELKIPEAVFRDLFATIALCKAQIAGVEIKDLAEYSYRVADAMVKERAKRIEDEE